MALTLSKKGILKSIRDRLETGPARSAATSAVATGVGYACGRTGKTKKIATGSIIAGAGANLLGLHTIGDGAMAGGATLLGYRLGVKKAAEAASSAMPAAPRQHQGKQLPPGKHRR